jgi:methyl-accepting chemotaxis protein
MSAKSSTIDFRRANRLFERRLTLVTSTSLALAVIVIAFSASEGRFSPQTYWGSIVIGLLALVSLSLGLTGRDKAAKWLLFIGGHSTVCVATVLAQTVEPITTPAMIYFTAISAFVLSPRTSLWMVAASVTTLFLAMASAILGGGSVQTTLATPVVSAVAVVAMGVVMFLFAERSIRTIESHNRRLEHNERLFQQVPDTASRLGAAAAELNAMSLKQRENALRQQTAIDEILASMRTLMKSSALISDSSQQSLRSAKTAFENATKVSRQIDTLTEQTTRISTVLDTIKDLSNKSEVLALNASLEGTKAGDAGRGFSLVASQMQKLAENIAAAAAAIRVMTHDIRQSTDSTQISIEESTKLARAATEAAEQINGSVHRERTSIEQVTSALDEIADISANVALATDETTASSEELSRLADTLTVMVERFRSQANTSGRNPSI